MATDDDKDPKVKALVERDPSQPLDSVVDAQTAAQLERWFGLPSFAQVGDHDFGLGPHGFAATRLVNEAVLQEP